MATFTTQCSTKRSEGQPSITTTITIDVDLSATEILRAFAHQAPVVKLQAIFRKMPAIPAKYEVKLSTLAAGIKVAARPMTFDEQMAATETYTPEQKAAMIARLTKA